MKQKEYHYTECGLDNVFIKNLDVMVDDRGEKCICIPAINKLHKCIAQALINKDSSLNNKEIRFLRTKIGLTQAELGQFLHRERLTIARWEKGEYPMDEAAETLLRKHIAESLNINITTKKLSEKCIASASTSPIDVGWKKPNSYYNIAA